MISDEQAVFVAFIASAVLAGGNAVAIRFSNRELDPLWGAGLRFSVAAALLVALMAALRLAVPRGRAALGAVLYGSLSFGAAFALFYYALVELQAGFGQIVLALIPLATLLLAVLQGQERLRFAAVTGALVGLIGIVLMSRTSLPDTVPLVSLLAAVGGALCVAQAAVLVRRFPRVHPVTMNAVGMATGGVLLFAGSAFAGESHPLPKGGETWAALVYLVVVGSVLVFVLYLFVLERWSASRTTYGFLIIPVVTVALSAWLDDEKVGLGLVLGGALVLVGVYIGAIRPTRE
jgi:drug/metabolite transporter (DMT)-like permease